MHTASREVTLVSGGEWVEQRSYRIYCGMGDTGRKMDIRSRPHFYLQDVDPHHSSVQDKRSTGEYLGYAPLKRHKYTP